MPLQKRTRQLDPFSRTILHLDLDCFYAQVEHNRLGVPLTIPLAVQQWNGLIAVNYAARDAGIKRHMPIAEAISKCPQLRLVHVPTYSVESAAGDTDGGDEDQEIVALPQYRDEMPEFRSDGPNPPDPSSSKACLEPYRHASTAIFKLIRNWCSELNGESEAQSILMEKAGLDEVFLDITEEVERQLIDEFDQKYTMILEELADLEDEALEPEALENLALYDLSWIENGLNFEGLGENAISIDDQIPSNNSSTESHIRMLLGKLRIWKGAQIAKDLRARLKKDLNFIASIGIASNKMLAKLVSALYKPDKQTRIEPLAVHLFMQRIPFEKIRMMGGKMGKSVLKGANENEAESDPDSDLDEDKNETPIGSSSTVIASDLQGLSVSELSERVGDTATAQWIHQLIRGIDPSPVTPRSLTKSFMAAKSFRPTVREWHELHDWIVILVTELWGRITEEREASSRWPSTITINYRVSSGKSWNAIPWNNSGSLSKSCEFPFSSSTPGQAKRSDFLAAVFKLLSNSDQAVLPMNRLALSVSNFKVINGDGKIKATRLDQFFPKQTDPSIPQSLPTSLAQKFASDDTVIIPKKQQQQQPPPQPIQQKPRKSVFEMLCATAKTTTVKSELIIETNATEASSKKMKSSSAASSSSENSRPSIKNFFSKQKSTTNDVFNCKECNFSCLPSEEKSIQEHLDHHLAIKLSRTF